MAYSDLREFIAELEKNKELRRIPFEVDPHLEITEFADRGVKHGGPALLFEKPKGSSIPVLINSFASARKMEIALQVDSVEEVAARISEYLEMRMPEGLIGKLRMLPKLAEMGYIAGRRTRAVSLHFLWYFPGIQTQASATVAATGCRSTTSALPECIGKRTSRAPSTIGGC